jgi:hypothetical protein
LAIAPLVGTVVGEVVPDGATTVGMTVVGLTVAVAMVLLPPMIGGERTVVAGAVGAAVVLLVPLELAEITTIALVVADGLGIEVVTPVTVEAIVMEPEPEEDLVVEALEDVGMEMMEMLEMVAELAGKEEDEPPTIWNGLEYWKVAGALSSEILMP